MAHPQIEIIVQAPGNPMRAVAHALAACAHGKHVVMVSVEGDACCSPPLARRGQVVKAVYALAYGDQQGLICDLVDWGCVAGFNVVAAGRGRKCLPHYGGVPQVDEAERMTRADLTAYPLRAVLRRGIEV